MNLLKVSYKNTRNKHLQKEKCFVAVSVDFQYSVTMCKSFFVITSSVIFKYLRVLKWKI